MKFKVYGPYEIPRGHKRLIVKEKLNAFWKEIEDEVPGLATACGCYVLATQTSGGSTATPWYIGKAEKSKFRNESLSSDKISKFNDMLDQKKRAKPMLFLLAQVTPTEKFLRPTANEREAIGELESLLIGMAIKENRHLLNIKGTKMFRELEVIGFLNSQPLARGGASKELRSTFGI